MAITAGESDCARLIGNLILGESRAIREVRGIIKFAAAARASVLITGPSGTGKELVAAALHGASNRAAAKFVAVNSGAIPRDLIESELFGHEKGSFTGAISRRIGHFEAAHRGTLFLDEIGEMPADMQVRLLRVLEDQRIRRIGSGEDLAVDVRMVAATHQCLDTAIRDGRFREDLYYRLAVLPIALPALAERIEDVPVLIEHFCSQGFVADAPPRFTAAAMDRLMAHDWPGNVRELRNLVDRAAVFSAGSEIGEEELDMLLVPGQAGRCAAAAGGVTDRGEAASPRPLPRSIDLKAHLQNEEKRVLIEALERSGGVVSAAARLVQLQRTTFIEKMKRYRIDRECSLAA